MNELDDQLYERIKKLCTDGDAAVKNSLTIAVGHYEAAWNLLPEPRTQWEAATWILAALGDAYYLSGEFTQGRDAFLTAMRCPDAIANPFLHLRLGQCQFELGFKIVAGDELSRAFLLAGDELFLEEDPKYLAYVKSLLDKPLGGWN